MTIQYVPRPRDDEALTALRLLQRGWEQKAVGYHMGWTRERVAVLKQRVLADDLKYSGEAPATVLAGYSA